MWFTPHLSLTHRNTVVHAALSLAQLTVILWFTLPASTPPWSLVVHAALSQPNPSLTHRNTVVHAAPFSPTHRNTVVHAAPSSPNPPQYRVVHAALSQLPTHGLTPPWSSGVHAALFSLTPSWPLWFTPPLSLCLTHRNTVVHAALSQLCTHRITVLYATLSQPNSTVILCLALIFSSTYCNTVVHAAPSQPNSTVMGSRRPYLSLTHRNTVVHAAPSQPTVIGFTLPYFSSATPLGNTVEIHAALSQLQSHRNTVVHAALSQLQPTAILFMLLYLSFNLLCMAVVHAALSQLQLTAILWFTPPYLVAFNPP
ncbi:hypothetical protein Hamer_G025832 [Homarus americanus]|uniref:Uncharacterized protein n=1 Tax=Homarus americanus TaxID=6706 RepID=A0A8J5MJT2_HOMAM|nr:hypothetical protein Hamer_G025832 [Homarus americanus]